MSSIEISDVKNPIDQGALIIHVRSEKEFSYENASNSVNIPLGDIENRFEEIRAMDRAIMICCGSGMRSSEAVKKLKLKGLIQVYNAGNWQKL